MTDRYLRIVLTVIAVELAWLGVKDLLPARVAAQAQPSATRVVITGVDLQQRTNFLPVAIAGTVVGANTPTWASSDRMLTTRVEAGDRPLRVEMGGAVNARIVEPIHVDTSQPLNVKGVVQTSTRPGL